MAVSEERGRGFEHLLLQLESSDSQNEIEIIKGQPFSSKGYNLYEICLASANSIL